MKDLTVKELIEKIKADKITVGDMQDIHKVFGITFLLEDRQIKGFGLEIKGRNGKIGNI